MREPEVVDLELTTDTLKASIRDAQRTVLELRNDLEARRRELAEVQVARAQLEGRVREAERRVVEARQVIELQREELAAARMERAHVSRNSLQLQSQMRQLQKQLSMAGKSSPAHHRLEAAPLTSSVAISQGQNAMQVSVQRDRLSGLSETLPTKTNPTAMMPVPTHRESSLGEEQPIVPAMYVTVKPSDTLWSIARKYRVRLESLRVLNHLTDNRIVIGQTLWLSEGQPLSEVGADKSATTP
jgi:LysM repeat protein